jgi:hypothetical protein
MQKTAKLSGFAVFIYRKLISDEHNPKEDEVLQSKQRRCCVALFKTVIIKVVTETVSQSA